MDVARKNNIGKTNLCQMLSLRLTCSKIRTLIDSRFHIIQFMRENIDAFFKEYSLFSQKVRISREFLMSMDHNGDQIPISCSQGFPKFMLGVPCKELCLKNMSPSIMELFQSRIFQRNSRITALRFCNMNLLQQGEYNPENQVNLFQRIGWYEEGQYAFPHLKKLIIRNTSLMNSDFVVDILKTCPSIEYLDLTGTLGFQRVRDIIVQVKAKNGTDNPIKTLILDNNLIDSRDIHELTNCNNLERLSLICSNITNLLPVLSSLGSKDSKLKKLRISHINGPMNRGDITQDFYDKFTQFSQLTHLDFTNYNLKTYREGRPNERSLFYVLFKRHIDTDKNKINNLNIENLFPCTSLDGILFHHNRQLGEGSFPPFDNTYIFNICEGLKQLKKFNMGYSLLLTIFYLAYSIDIDIPVGTGIKKINELFRAPGFIQNNYQQTLRTTLENLFKDDKFITLTIFFNNGRPLNTFSNDLLKIFIKNAAINLEKLHIKFENQNYIDIEYINDLLEFLTRPGKNINHLVLDFKNTLQGGNIFELPEITLTQQIQTLEIRGYCKLTTLNVPEGQGQGQGQGQKAQKTLIFRRTNMEFYVDVDMERIINPNIITKIMQCVMSKTIQDKIKEIYGEVPNNLLIKQTPEDVDRFDEEDNDFFKDV